MRRCASVCERVCTCVQVCVSGCDCDCAPHLLDRHVQDLHGVGLYHLALASQRVAQVGVLEDEVLG